MLDKINPDLLKQLNIDELEKLAQEIREEIIKVTSENGGHLASNLGVVELTIALHYVFSSPHDKIIFDVSHQTYAHKLLTGRFEDFDTLRKENGISGFSKMSESEHDVYEAGHSSTSISAGLGFLEAKKQKKDDIGEVIAVVGDASVVNGLCFEALNYLGDHQEEKMIIIVNDNNMSVSKNVGALAKRYNKIRTSKGLKLFKKIVPIRLKHAMQYYAYKVDTFTSFGFKYFENIDGHDFRELIRYLTYAKNYKQSIVLHVKTIKGKGYEPAEKDEIGFYHGLGPFNIDNGKPKKEKKSLTFGENISNRLCEMVKDNNGQDIRVICPAMILGCGLKTFSEQYPNQIIDVGIAEENAVVMASSMALAGLKPIVFVYSTFIQRAYDQILHDVARINNNVIFCIDHSGIVSGDGNTHQGIYDLAMFNSIPNLVILNPVTGLDAANMVSYCLNQKGPFVIRYPKGEANDTKTYFNNNLNWQKLKESLNKKYIISYGPDILDIEEKINENDEFGLIYTPATTPLDYEFLNNNPGIELYCFEQVIKNGSLSMNIASYIIEKNLNIKLVSLTLPNTFVDEGTNDEIRNHYGLTIDNLLSKIRKGE